MIETIDNGNILKDTIEAIERDEGDVMSTLCSILAKVHDSGKTSCLAQVAASMNKWTACPPSKIVEELQAVEDELDGQ